MTDSRINLIRGEGSLCNNMYVLWWPHHRGQPVCLSIRSAQLPPLAPSTTSYRLEFYSQLRGAAFPWSYHDHYLVFHPVSLATKPYVGSCTLWATTHASMSSNDRWGGEDDTISRPKIDQLCFVLCRTLAIIVPLACFGGMGRMLSDTPEQPR